MKLSDFDIGTEFQTSTWHRWRCTDVGRRTILAIELDPDQGHRFTRFCYARSGGLDFVKATTHSDFCYSTTKSQYYDGRIALRLYLSRSAASDDLPANAKRWRQQIVIPAKAGSAPQQRGALVIQRLCFRLWL